jgi:hypothetical protein
MSNIVEVKRYEFWIACRRHCISFYCYYLEASSGNIEFKGASGPIIMWVVCFSVHSADYKGAMVDW